MKDNITIDAILQQMKKSASKKDLELVYRAFKFATKTHENQFRKTGEPYIIHPLFVAYRLALIKLDATTIAAGLLHDVVENTPVTLKEIESNFGSEIAFLVDGVTKLGKVRIKKGFTIDDFEAKSDPTSFHSFQRQADVLRKMFVAMAKDIRVILIKLADRRHNMETLHAVDPAKQLRIARETLDIFAPIAHRLGMGELKGYLEDLAFPYVYPKEYNELKSRIGDRLSAKSAYLKKVTKALQSELEPNNIKTEIHGRAKHLYSLYRKLQRYDNNLDQIYDLIALRIIVDNIEECYTVLGIIHKLWKPLPGRIKDYIATPKPNGYQSLHTTVFCIDGEITEFQIRTHAMHEQAEYGIAAHWHYKNSSESGNDNPGTTDHKELLWIKQLADWQNKLSDPEELAESLKLDFFEDRIFIFTPQGDVHNLPVGATPIDFAFAIHSDIGTHCSGAKINGKMVTLNHQLHNGDMVEIITAKKSLPKRDWLNFVKTSHARNIIRQYAKQDRIINPPSVN